MKLTIQPGFAFLHTVLVAALAQALLVPVAAQEAPAATARFQFDDGRIAQARAVSAQHYTLEVEGWDVPATHIGTPLAATAADIDEDGRDDILVLVDRAGPNEGPVVDVFDLDGEGPVLMFVTRGGHDATPSDFAAQSRIDYAVRMGAAHLRDASLALRALNEDRDAVEDEATLRFQRAFWIDEIEAAALAELLAAERVQFDELDDMRAIRRALLRLEYLRSERAELNRRQAARFAAHAEAVRATEGLGRREN